MLKRIQVRYELEAAPEADRAAIQRAFESHMPKCPIYRSLRGAISIHTSLDLLPRSDA